ncbi:MAG: alpha-amylase [Calditrichae bacterium]|nr:alpha-amylase [Calditrichota bacterium]MCB9059812.1 alpha-amylase [Calditrichia bacterium]
MKIFLKTTLLLLSIYSLISCSDDDIVNQSKDDETPISFDIPATEDMVMYEVNLRAMSNTGDFQGVIDKLDHIKSLGVNVIWLMPIYPIGELKSVNSPYCVQNYTEVNPEFGTMNDFKELIDQAHTREMAVVIDWVANHTAWDNPWIANKSWYSQNGAGEIIIPPGTNWADVADLNYNNTDMRQAMIDAMRFWVEDVNVDGFRCDAADMVPFDFWQQAISALEKIEGHDLIYLAEGERKDHFDAGFQMNYGWEFYSGLKDVFIDGYTADLINLTHLSEYRSLPGGAQKLRFTTNHDESAWDATPINLFGANGSIAAFVISTYLGGVPLIYSSQEVATQDNVSFFNNDPIDWSSNPAFLEKYQQILAVYTESPALRKGEIQNFEDLNIVVFKKIYNDEEILVMVNIRNRTRSLSIPEELQNSTWTDAISGNEITLGTTLSFQSYQYFVLK